MSRSIDPENLWVRADVGETYIDSIRIGDTFPVRLPSGAERQGTVFFRGLDADFATQRDVQPLQARHQDLRNPPALRQQGPLAGRRDDRLRRPAAHEALIMFAVEVENLTKRFGDFCAVDNLNFTVPEGEIFGLLGPNGAGKSTLIRMLTTLVLPTSGIARVNGFDVVKNANQVRQSIGVIPQAMTSDLDLSAYENMSIFAKLYGIPREKRQRTIRDLLQAVDLEKWTDKPVKMFSGGMRRRLEIARGLVHEPKLFFSTNRPPGWTPSPALPCGTCSRN